MKRSLLYAFILILITAPSVYSADQCFLIKDPDLRHLCRNEAVLIQNSDLRNMAEKRCLLIHNRDLYHYCRGEYLLIRDDKWRALATGNCNSLDIKSDLHKLCLSRN